MAGIFVWPLAIRLGHWLLVATTVIAWLTRHWSGRWHEAFGYAVLGVVALRVAAGLLARPPYAFRSFVASPARTMAYVRLLKQPDLPPAAGHNPLGGWMVIILIVLLLIVSLTGWLYTTDRFWGVEWVGNTHLWSTNGLIIAVVLHVAGVLFSSWHERRNLIAAMIHGRKPL